MWKCEYSVYTADGLCKFSNTSVFIVSFGLLESMSQNLYLRLAENFVKMTSDF